MFTDRSTKKTTVFRLTLEAINERIRSEKPEYIYKSNKIRYFTKTINEYQGIVIGTNPLNTLLNEFPIGLEYYWQERLGYEILFVYHREDFFEFVNDIGLNEPYTRGLSIRFRQKFYHTEGTLGMFYFGHQLGATLNTHFVKAQDQTVLPFERTTLEVNETLGYYGIFTGLRWMKNGQNPGLTIDAFVGLDLGFRNWDELYDVSNQEFNDQYRSFTRSNLYLPIRFGVHIGLTKRVKKKQK